MEPKNVEEFANREVAPSGKTSHFSHHYAPDVGRAVDVSLKALHFRMQKGKGLLVILLASFLCCTTQAEAVEITFSTTGVGTFFVPGGIDDLIQVMAQGDTSLSLDPGVPVQATINVLGFYVQPTDWWSGTYGFSINRSMTIGAETLNIYQTGAVYLGFISDSAAVFDSTTPTYFTIPEGTVKVTPLAVSTGGLRSWESATYGLPASFEYTPTPEPATLSLLALGGLAMLRRRRG